MPLISVRTSLTDVKNSKEILKALSEELAKSTGKPEQYVMTLIQNDLPMTFGGNNDPCCYLEIKSIGSLKPNEMTEVFSKIISDMMKIPINRIYISFEDVEPSRWGVNGKTFG